MHKKLVCAALVFLAALAARADDWNKNFAVSGKPELVVETDDGNVSVVTGVGGQVAAAVHTIGWRIAEDEVRIDARQSGNRIELTVRKTHGTHFGFGHYSIRVSLTVPAESDMNVHTKDGNIEVTGVRGNHVYRSGDGNLKLDSLEGNLHAETGDGNINLDGRFDALDLHTGDGNIDAAVRRGSKMTSGWSMRTGDGNIRVQLPQDFSADVEANTGDGRVHSDLPITVGGSVDSHNLRGKLNGGGSLLELHTGDGDIRLERVSGSL